MGTSPRTSSEKCQYDLFESCPFLLKLKHSKQKQTKKSGFFFKTMIAQTLFINLALDMRLGGNAR